MAVNTKKIKKISIITIATLLACLLIYLLFVLIPYMGRPYVSTATREAFSMDNFFGDTTIPEQVMLLDNPNESFLHRVNIKSEAQEQILLTSFSIHDSTSTDIVVGALLYAADRGVNVRILNNGLTGTIPSRYRRVLVEHENIDIYIFNRLNLFRLHYINSNLHDKYMIIDNRYMILGGRNMSDRYFNPEGYEGRIAFDMEVLVYNTNINYDGVIYKVKDYFNRKVESSHSALYTRRNKTDNWEEEKDAFINIYKEYKEAHILEEFDYLEDTIPVNKITLLTNTFEGTKKESIIAYNLMMIARNSSSITVEVPYVSVTRRNLSRLTEIIRDSEFTLVTNSLGVTGNLPAFSSYYVDRRRMINAGAVIYEFQGENASLHGKTFLFDGRLTVIGSFNLNERSIRSDTEAVLVIDSEDFYNITKEAINNTISRSLRVDENLNYIANENVEEIRPGWSKRAIYTTFGHLFRPLHFLF
ncbi:MAG: phosphatidylserine/phosphatidylglycerophosphate/cardiolipin synthase family protein [Oscillospiraceae bacterium]|nr:phosphatidylserine/phosphatidylglycerophosphate/cardiolipin synthase family protein [Oscillospiraceae bacterium]